MSRVLVAQQLRRRRETCACRVHACVPHSTTLGNERTGRNAQLNPAVARSTACSAICIGAVSQVDKCHSTPSVAVTLQHHAKRQTRASLQFASKGGRNAPWCRPKRQADQLCEESEGGFHGVVGPFPTVICAQTAISCVSVEQHSTVDHEPSRTSVDQPGKERRLHCGEHIRYQWRRHRQRGGAQP